MSDLYRKWLVNYGFTQVGFVPVDFMDSEEDINMVEEMFSN